MESRLSFLSDNLEIEALMEFKSARKGIAITHPHPLYGDFDHGFWTNLPYLPADVNLISNFFF